MLYRVPVPEVSSPIHKPQSPFRRQLLKQFLYGATTGMGLASVGCGRQPVQPVPVGLQQRDFIVHDETNWETRSDRFGTSTITPYGSLYICNHLPFPDRHVIDKRAEWQLEVLGTQESRSLSLAELQSIGSESVVMTLQCAGNGRKFFDHTPDGPNWSIGAVGCVQWTGVAVKHVVAMLGGVSPEAKYATATGGESVNDVLDEMFSMRVERSLPIAKVQDDCLLAWNMNGKPIPLVHGGPLRLIVPGYYGVNQIKYLKKLAFTEMQSDADVMQHEYRMRPVGEEGNETQPTTWAMEIKSIIWPATTAIRRSSFLHGVAFGGLDPVDSVEVTLNDGRDWFSVPFSDSQMGRYAWRRFSFRMDVPPGTWRVASRAVDKAGRRQPEWRTPNAGGYTNTSWRDHAVEVKVV